MMDEVNYLEEIGNALDAVAQSVTEIDEHEIDLSIDYPEPKFTLIKDGIGTIPRGDIQAIKAKSKNGKSYVCSILIASTFGCTEFGFSTSEKEPTILYFDTEQNKRNTAKLEKRVFSKLGWDVKKNRKCFRAYSLRELDADKRLSFIESRIIQYHPTIAFIDGIADLIPNFNEVEQSSDLINQLMKLSSENDCALCNVLHTNKGKDDSGMKGHLGTMLLQKASDVFEVKKNDKIFHVTETDCRNLPIPEFSFSIDEAGLPIAAPTEKEEKNEERIEAMNAIINEVYLEKYELSYNELIQSYQLCGAVSESTAKRAIRKAKQLNLIELTHDKKYRKS